MNKIATATIGIPAYNEEANIGKFIYLQKNKLKIYE